jgi:hypothetical protein
MPGGWIGYAEKADSDFGPVIAETDVTGLTVTVTVGANRRIRVTGDASLVSNGSSAEGRIKEGVTILGRFGRLAPPATSDLARQSGSVVLTPSAGSHTYKLTVLGTTPGVEIMCSAQEPAFILVEDLGPAS